MEFYSVLPLTAVVVLTALFWRVDMPLRPVWVALCLVTLLTCLADWYLLARLPRLGLSFGPVNPPLFMLNFIRLLPLLLVLFILGMTSQLWQRLFLLAIAGFFQIAFLVACYTSLYIEPFRLTLSELPLPAAPSFLPERPLRILQLSDLHVEHITSREKAVFELTKTLSPDIIVLTGDYINKSYIMDPQSRQETRLWLSGLQAPYGVYAINGNLDYGGVMEALFEGMDNIRVLEDEIVPLTFPGGTLQLVGGVTADHKMDYHSLDFLLDELPAGGYSLLIYHYPERVDVASLHGVDLFLAGDTHGGQVRLPFIGSLAARTMWHPYIMGKYQVGPTTLYVSRGLGMQGGVWPRLRMNCPPEIVLVTLGK